MFLKGDSTARAIFIVQGRVFFEDLFLAAPRYKSRASFSSVLKSLMQTGGSFFNRSQDAIANLPSSDRLVSGTLAAGQSFAVVDEVLGQELNDAPWMQCDQVAVSPCETCWTIEVHANKTASSFWPPTRQWTLDALLTLKKTTNSIDGTP